MVSIDCIKKQLGVTEMQVKIAIYSGALPRPTDMDEWEEAHIKPFLVNWQARIDRSREEAR